MGAPTPDPRIQDTAVGRNRRRQPAVAKIEKAIRELAAQGTAG